MYKDNDFVYEAFSNLQELVKMEITVDSTRQPYDAVIQISNHTFYCIAKKNARKSSLGIVINQINEFKNSIKQDRRILFVGEYIAKDVADSLIQNNINYLDVSGNCFINADDLKIIIEGRKQIKQKNVNQARAFQEAGLKLILLLLTDKEALEYSYRMLADKANIALGSVSQIMKELEESNYILKTNEKRILKNIDDLIERWVVSYNDILKPRLLRKTYKAINLDYLRKIVSDNNTKFLLFGGEPAAEKMTNYLKPLEYIIYSNDDLSIIGKELMLVPDNNGNIKIYNTCWTESLNNEYLNIAPALVVYADLIGSGNSRNIETAKMILENEL
ncbi:hypothetical protein G6N05_14115 [Flavobacterium sp. F372]|uniref:Winged helix-turn-helix transcriptional regulator n=1 Tax=Flavobacterium bernardetii TaxID=2813823 RepID=A0ABR7J2E6_9FLAO|nr:type IV toxin-antitoxin system AbiEi family antitoxin [Flavobacterium bernardetii]MBC5836014.1 hypothetical protein [Flavobacterium bernardetii]NHF71246.1 hypothetical protein [Flavobacterium bernardetii]